MKHGGPSSATAQLPLRGPAAASPASFPSPFTRQWIRARLSFITWCMDPTPGSEEERFLVKHNLATSEWNDGRYHLTNHGRRVLATLNGWPRPKKEETW